MQLHDARSDVVALDPGHAKHIAVSLGISFTLVCV